MSVKKKNLHGLQAKHFPRSIKWRLDADYVKKLSPEEKQWLADFNDMYYGADFRCEHDWTDEERRKAYVDKNVANVDLYSAVDSAGMMAPLDDQQEADPTSPDIRPTPRFLSSPEYKEAVGKFRAHLHQGRKATPPVDTPAFRAARRRLEAITRGEAVEDIGPQDSDDDT